KVLNDAGVDDVLRRNLDELELVGKNIDEIKKAGGYKAWKISNSGVKLIDDLVNSVDDAYKAGLRADLEASTELVEAIGKNPELIKSWKTLKKANVDDAIRTNIDELTDVSRHLDDIDNFGGYNTWRLRTGRAKHPNWTQVDDITNKVIAREPHVLKVETKADGSFYPKSKTIDSRTFNMEGFKGCHSENALKEYIQANGGTYTVKNKSIGQGGVYEGQPVISINNKEYVKINGRFVEYETGKLGGTASFFPEGWSNTKIKQEVEHAIKNNHGKVNVNNPNDQLHFGYSTDGKVEIQFYFDSVRDYVGSYFPKKR
ncbi:EndoU domain-containing protein, partial [Aquimarina addita]|uniref:EndoU domain-containing protein n=1 Tax=Aquimarina addita TaxID=870485 RepID=UPI0031E7BA8A